jgi:hypothetical protein
VAAVVAAATVAALVLAAVVDVVVLVPFDEPPPQAEKTINEINTTQPINRVFTPRLPFSDAPAGYPTRLAGTRTDLLNASLNSIDTRHDQRSAIRIDTSIRERSRLAFTSDAPHLTDRGTISRDVRRHLFYFNAGPMYGTA